MEQNTVSVIVAIYKVGDYLEQCVQSILDQSYRNLEIILVDDGSPDKSHQICDEFCRKDERVQVLHKVNGGSVYARRDGLLKATGKYVLLIDGDDFADSEYINNLVKTAESENVDAVVDSFLMSYSNREYVEKIYLPVGIYKGEKLEALKQHMIYSGEYFKFGINPALWNKLFRRDKLLKYYKDVPRGLTLGDDFAVSMPYLANADSVAILDSGAYYHYRQRADSMVKAYNAKLVHNMTLLMNYLNNSCLEEIMVDQLSYYYSWITLSVVKNQLHCGKNSNDRMEALQKVYELPNIIKHLEKIKISPLKYRIGFWMIRYHKLKLLEKMRALLK